ncbi:ISXO2 transposase-like protein [Aquimarina sp. MAR_2010_214]|uniref:IS1595 family transposase n=1 Tax=Aquimarina sp. MAR_2010_214 TaxID=1250026 RepID=UPI000C706550|nr:IS1595 family transposase [Aquimarina sp. MAR_2010_214]PKV49867.1 ISXO2 transposase-like protein [Aquimarina sp. MAR_2010_214]PKV50193.1 ISXO2 transposase-like protein [Aquimarina sp. MAR_2010_214]PKV51797.1 ISXO2 transposase-like protein [Aquimarina sp. MAR_2010_214]PKV52561.1 ISXO2 transposase-like protein [Aquimarina sp. MAR_2010_214]PKV53021.1 ISXO2 transposase-like protein [Aquimarina sp. MAR_2010_214]
MNVFKGQNLLEFSDRFKTDEDCKEYLASMKSEMDYKCLRCNHTACQVRKDFSRQCNICGHIESATANTLFHKVKFGVRKAFFICFEMSTTTKSLSASYMGVRYGVTEKTARLFMLKVREAMGSGGNNPMDGDVHVDEFVLGGRDQGKTGRSYDGKKKKAVTAVQLTEDGKVKRMYAMKINDFSAQSLQYIFVNHISREANVTTDQWRGYRPISKAYNITQLPSNRGLNFKALHTMIHQVKSWIRTTYSWVSDENLNRYFNEFCFRINRSQSKATIFNNLITKMVQGDKIYHKELISN